MWKATISFLRDFSVMIAALTLLTSAVWWALENKVRETTREMAGTDEVIQSLSGVKNELIEQSTLIKDVANEVAYANLRIDELTPRPRIVEYDAIRSKVITQGNDPHRPTCAVGSPCKYVYFVRRTPFGEPCGKPVAERILIDQAGVTSYPRASVGGPDTILLGRDWARIEGGFDVPHGVTTGTAEFMLSLVYSRCGDDGNISMQEFSHPLVFDIVKEDQL